MIGVEIVKDQKTKEYGADLRDKIVEASFAKGVLFLAAAPAQFASRRPLIVTANRQTSRSMFSKRQSTRSKWQVARLSSSQFEQGRRRKWRRDT